MESHIIISETNGGFRIESKPLRNYRLIILGAFWITLWFFGIGTGVTELLKGSLPKSRFDSMSTLGFSIWLVVSFIAGLLYLNHWIHQVFGREILETYNDKLIFTRTKRLPHIHWELHTSRIYSIAINKDYYSSKISFKGEYLLHPEGGMIFRVSKKKYYYGTGLPYEKAEFLVNYLNENIQLQ